MTTVVGTVSYGGETISYEVRFVEARRTLGIEVHPDSRVIVRAPPGCTSALIETGVKKRAAWISRQLAEFEQYRPRTPARQYVSGESHLYLGRQYRLKVETSQVTSVTLTRGQIRVTLPGDIGPERVKRVLHRWYLDRARAVFIEAIQDGVQGFPGIAAPRLIVRTMQSRWGSLSRAGTMTLNVNLVRAPRPCIDYVVVHELCHALYRDHDGRFYKLLGRVMPDWEARKRRLEAALL
ncbi:MAG: SprT family zinc-dependent metalloprotease [Burkholderiales bacterium]|nr:SprT family zinc-dependent metalloprotease [Burkholderiales bacterium]